MTAPKKPSLIPFDHEGNLMDYVGYVDDDGRISVEYEWYTDAAGESQRRETGREGEWRENYEFDATMIFEGIERGRSAARFKLRDERTGSTYIMFLTDTLDMIQRAELIVYGHVQGRWTFQKRGSNYGIRLV